MPAPPARAATVALLCLLLAPAARAEDAACDAEGADAAALLQTSGARKEAAVQAHGVSQVPAGCESQTFTTPSNTTFTGLGCTFEAMAKAWVAAGGSKDDCPNVMAIALGEGLNPDCKSSMDTCLGTTKAFPLDMPPYDNQCTLGPWQVLTSVMAADSPNVRAQEAMDYAKYNCGTPATPSDCASQTCFGAGISYPNCPTLTTGTCLCASCPSEPDSACSKGWNPADIPTTIFSSSVATFCGCAATLTPTTGWSGRCSNSNPDDYQQHVATTQTWCDKIAW